MVIVPFRDPCNALLKRPEVTEAGMEAPQQPLRALPLCFGAGAAGDGWVGAFGVLFFVGGV